MAEPEFDVLRDELTTAAGLLCQASAGLPVGPYLSGSLGRAMLRINEVHRALRGEIGSTSFSNDNFDPAAARAALLEQLLNERQGRKRGRKGEATAAASDDETRQLRAQVTFLREALTAIKARAAHVLGDSPEAPQPSQPQAGERAPARARSGRKLVGKWSVREDVTAAPKSPSMPAAHSDLPSGALRMLEALATFYPAAMTKGQVANWADLKQSGGYRTYWSTLSTRGLLERADGDTFRITDRGLAQFGVKPQVPKNLQDRITFWMSRLNAGERRMLDAVLANPNGLTKEEIGTASDLAVSGGFRTYLSTLRTCRLIDKRGNVFVPHPWLMNGPGGKAR